MVRTSAARVAVAVFAVLVTGATGVPPAGAATASEGSLDLTFGYDGQVLDPGLRDSTVQHAVMQPNGYVVVISLSDLGGQPTISRYRPNGGLDTGFGDHGRVSSVWPGSGTQLGLGLQSNGRILVAGGNYSSILVGRYLSDGRVDTLFGDNGVVTKTVTGLQDYAHAVLQQPDGKIVVGGIANGDMFLTRLLPDGDTDLGFGTNGIVTANYQRDVGGQPSGTETLDAMALDGSGRIVTVGSEFLNGFSGIIVRRWTSSGQPDATFGGGVQVFLVSDATHALGSSVALQPDGKILVGGYALFSDYDGLVMRLTSAGAQDSSFGTANDTTSFGTFYLWRSGFSGDDIVNGVTRQRDGKVMAVGRTDPNVNRGDFLVARLSTGGSPDATFNTPNPSAVDFDFAADKAQDVMVGRDGRITVVGSSGQDPLPAMARLIGDATAPAVPSFAALPMFSLAAKQRVRWTATDDNTGVKSYDVQRRTGSYTSSKLTAWNTVKSSTTTKYVDVKRAPGVMTCFRVRARDWAGNVGSYSGPHCTTFPVDDRKLSAHGTWSSLTGSSYYLGTARRSSSAGSSLTISATFRQLAVVASTCPTCGKAKVYLGKTLLGTLDLHSSTTHNRVLEFLPPSTTVRSGTLRILQAAGGKPVTIDGFGLTLDSAA